MPVYLVSLGPFRIDEQVTRKRLCGIPSRCHCARLPVTQRRTQARGRWCPDTKPPAETARAQSPSPHEAALELARHPAGKVDHQAKFWLWQNRRIV